MRTLARVPARSVFAGALPAESYTLHSAPYRLTLSASCRADAACLLTPTCCRESCIFTASYPCEQD